MLIGNPWEKHPEYRYTEIKSAEIQINQLPARAVLPAPSTRPSSFRMARKAWIVPASAAGRLGALQSTLET